MASIPVTIVGVMSYSGLEVGGGPMPGGPPLGTWGGDAPWPGYATPPMAPGGPPPWVSHPIPPTVWPNPPVPWTKPPLGTWGGDAPWPGYATPPIFIGPPAEKPEGPIEWKAAWSPQTGWIVVGVPTGPTPTPSA